MPTLHIYKYAFKEKNLRRGIQLLRGSHDVIPGQALEVGHERQLLMDWHVVDDWNGCCRTVHQPQKHPDNPIVSGQEPYEAEGPNGFGTVMRDPESGLFRMWVPVWDRKLAESEGKGHAVMRGHYYESDDGLTWRRPHLKLYDYAGSKQNNIFIQSYTDNLYVVALPQRMWDHGRYAMLYCYITEGTHLKNPEREHGSRNYIGFSEDGIHWTEAPENPIWSGRNDGGNSLVYNPDRDVFMMFRRATINAGEIRRIAYSESRDLISWSQPITIIRCDEDDPRFLYSMQVTRYHGVYLGLLHCLHSEGDKNRKLLNGMDHQMDTQLAWSRDGIQWHRGIGKPTFIPTSASARDVPDWGMAHGMGNIMEMEDHVRVYYGGREWLHGGYYNGVPDVPKRCNICLATLRPDGFVSIDAGTDGGFVLTKPMKYPGGRLHINARTESDGFVRIAVREGIGERDGSWSDAWQFDKSLPFNGDSVDQVMAWEADTNLASFPGQGVMRLHFWLENAELYSFWFE